MEPQIVLITGATGFLGSHIVEHFLNTGYIVRALCRSSKADELRERSSDPKFSVAISDDITTDDFSSILQDVYAVVHVASPTPFYGNHIEVAVKGTLNVLTKAYAAGVRKIIFISSIYSALTDYRELLDPSRVFDNDSWGTVPEFLREQSKRYVNEALPRKIIPSSEENKTLDETLHEPEQQSQHSGNREQQEDINPFVAYAFSKLLAEETVWAFSDAYSDTDVISILPTYFYGPFSKFHVIREATTLSTNYILYSIFARPVASYPPESIPDHVVDVRDVAKACVLAMSPRASSSTTPSRRRILLCSGTFSWKEVSAEIARAYPEIKNRVVEAGEPKELLKRRGAAQIDVSMAKQLLGLDEFIPWQTSVKDAVECLLETENQWNP